jgi:hypothetical protein
VTARDVRVELEAVVATLRSLDSATRTRLELTHPGIDPLEIVTTAGDSVLAPIVIARAQALAALAQMDAELARDAAAPARDGCPYCRVSLASHCPWHAQDGMREVYE